MMEAQQKYHLIEGSAHTQAAILHFQADGKPRDPGQLLPRSQFSRKLETIFYQKIKKDNIWLGTEKEIN